MNNLFVAHCSHKDFHKATYYGFVNPEKIEIYITAVTWPPAAHVDIVIFSKLAVYHINFRVQTSVLNGQNRRDARYCCPGLGYLVRNLLVTSLAAPPATVCPGESVMAGRGCLFRPPPGIMY